MFDDSVIRIWFIRALWVALALALLGLFDELNTPAHPKKSRRTGTVHWDESKGEKESRRHD